MHALVVTAHGSRRKASNDEVITLTEHIRALAGERFTLVESAFLELAEPSIPQALENCVRKGATRITIAPYFLAGGTHVVKDIPDIVAAAASRYPDIDFRISPHVGLSASMPRLVLDAAGG